MIKEITRKIILLSAVLSLTGCFTGIESTPKITANDVKKEKVVSTPEDTFLNTVQPQPLSQWTPGKLFYVTDNRINLALEPSSAPAPVVGDLISFRDFTPVVSLTGETETRINFLDKNNHELSYRVPGDISEVKTRERLEIPFTIELSLVNETARLLEGRTFYIRTSLWYDKDDNTYRRFKFIPVEVTDVAPGNSVYPVKVYFKAPAYTGDEEFHLFMSVGENTKSSRNFASLFYFNDPYLRHQSITPENWAMITRGQVAQYMTREECRLALGAPKTVDRYAAISSLQERWGYENGIYLIFDDGLLISFRR